MAFAPIAIVGQGCILPQAASPQELWRLVADRRDALRPAPAGYWHHATLDGLTHPEEPPLPHLLSGRGGYVDGFAGLFDAQGFHLPAERILALDALFQWLLYAGRDALRSAGHDTRTRSPRAGAIVGNLSYPTPAMVSFAERVWWHRAPDGARAVDPRNRFSSGLPAHTLAAALGLGAGAFALDAACASSLYAIKLACDWLHDGRADLMLAGGVNGADGFIIHGGFSVLQAISPSGRSRPFHSQADGLVPAEGAALVALKRLDDAEAAGDRILGVIRGVGLSNDGRGQGFLAPSDTGQARAMREAYACAGLRPADVSFVECHATGTPVGDAVEIRSMTQVFEGVKDLPIGSLKSNLGHLITAAGAAGLLKVLAAMDAGIRPPNAHADAPIAALASSPFRLLDAPEPWESDGPRRAGLSAFGFGGNNAHLIVEEWRRQSRPRAASPPREAQDVAITAVGVRVGDCSGRETFARALLAGDSLTSAGEVRTIELDLSTLRFPPNDLKAALPQQLLILETAQQIAEDVARLPGDRTGVFVGMQCDAEGARIAARCRLPHSIGALDGAYAGVSQPLTPAGVLGAMANIVANRLHSWFDLKGPGCAVSAEELSGLMALDAGARAVSRGELDAAIVGAVDLSCEPVHEAAAAALLPPPHRPPADAAVVLILKRLADARRDGDTTYAVLPAQPGPHADLQLGPHAGALNALSGMGHAHAASGLLHVAAAALACYHRAVPVPDAPAVPWLPASEGRAAAVSVKAFSGPTHQTLLRPEPGMSPAPPFAVPALRVYTADSRDELLRALEHDAPGDRGSMRLALVSADARAFPALREQALAALRAHRGTPQRLCELAEGVYLGEVAPSGDLGFVFTGPAGAYPQMGRELLVALPELADGVLGRFEWKGDAAGWLYGGDAANNPGALDQLWAASFLSQVHAELTRGPLGLTPQAAIGFCSGETNALLALGAWSEMGGMYEGLAACPLFAPDQWASWRILAPVAEVRRALLDEPRVHLTIVSAPDDVVIAGDDACCRRVGSPGTELEFAL